MALLLFRPPGSPLVPPYFILLESVACMGFIGCMEMDRGILLASGYLVEARFYRTREQSVSQFSGYNNNREEKHESGDV
jgi:hypothetical protein